MTLTFKEPPKDAALHPNFLLYGPPKSGKSLGAASLAQRGKVLYANADTDNSTYLAHKFYPGQIEEVEVDGLQTLIDIMLLAEQMATKPVEEREFQTVVLDPIGDIHRLTLEGLSNRAIRPSLNQYGDVNVHIERFCRKLCKLPVNFVIVAHEFPVQDESTGEVEKLLWTGTKAASQQMSQKLLGMVDVAGYTSVLIPEDGGKKQFVAQLVTSKGRRGGDRFGVLGDWQPLNLSAWVEMMEQTPAENMIQMPVTQDEADKMKAEGATPPDNNKGAKPEKEAAPA